MSRNAWLGTVDRRLLATEVYERIRMGIVEGRFAPGQRLSEERLREELGVSRTPVREALRRLSSEGLVRLEPHKGATVVSFSPQEIREAYFVRSLLEGGAARRVAERVRAGECDLSLLDRICDQHVQVVAGKCHGNTRASRYRSLTRLNKLFHEAVLELSGCGRLRDLMRTQWPVFDRLTLRFALLPDAERLVQEHRGIVEVMRAGMAEEAEAKMREHIVRAGEAVVRYWGGETGGTGGKGAVAGR